MKKVVVSLAVVTVLGLSALAFAHGPGWWSGSHMMGPGMHTTGWNCGGGACFGPYGYDKKFLDETRELRKQLHDKRFEYFEALRDPNIKPETITKLEKELSELQQKLYEKAPKTAYMGSYGRFGTRGWGCWH
jgi:hypothetical protein